MNRITKKAAIGLLLFSSFGQEFILPSYALYLPRNEATGAMAYSSNAGLQMMNKIRGSVDIFHPEFGEWWGVGLFVVDIFWRQDNLKFTRRVQHRLSELQLKVDSLVAASPTSQEYLREQLEENVDDQINDSQTELQHQDFQAYYGRAGVKRRFPWAKLSKRLHLPLNFFG